MPDERDRLQEPAAPKWFLRAAEPAARRRLSPADAHASIGDAESPVEREHTKQRFELPAQLARQEQLAERIRPTQLDVVLFDA